jgi:hypothetical protein
LRSTTQRTHICQRMADMGHPEVIGSEKSQDGA